MWSNFSLTKLNWSVCRQNEMSGMEIKMLLDESWNEIVGVFVALLTSQLNSHQAILFARLYQALRLELILLEKVVLLALINQKCARRSSVGFH